MSPQIRANGKKHGILELHNGGGIIIREGSMNCVQVIQRNMGVLAINAFMTNAEN